MLDYKDKYLKYKTKYFNLKNILKNQKGGGLIGVGSFGCVYSPPLKCVENNCVGDKCTHGISKIMTPENTTIELSNLKRLELDIVDPEQIYHISNPHMCTPTIPEEELTRCNIEKQQRGTPKIENPQQLIYENGGTDLYNLANYTSSIPDLTLKNKYIEYILRNLFFNSLSRLLFSSAL